MMLQIRAVIVFLAIGLVACCDYTSSHYSKSFVSKGETFQDFSACNAFTSIEQPVSVFVNATADCEIYVCKRSKGFLKLSEIILAKSNTVATAEVPLGMGGVNTDLAICKMGSDKIYFNELRLQFDQ